MEDAELVITSQETKGKLSKYKLCKVCGVSQKKPNAA